MRRLFYILVFCVAAQASALLELGCDLALEIQAQASYDDDCTYLDGFCFANSGELGRALVNHPENPLRVEDLKILILRHRKSDLRFSDTVTLRRSLLGSEKHYRHETTAVWSFHAVLSYRGRVVDLDKKQGWKLAPFEQYAGEMFPLMLRSVSMRGEEGFRFPLFYNIKWNTQVIEMPLSVYLERFPEHRPVGEIAMGFVEDYPVYSLREYERVSAQQR